MLSWTRRELAEKASVAERTIIDFERGARRPHKRTLTALRNAVESSGIEILPDDGNGPGLRMRRG